MFVFTHIQARVTQYGVVMKFDFTVAVELGVAYGEFLQILIVTWK